MNLSQSDWDYAHERAGLFAGREWVFAQIRDFLSGPPGAFLLRGDPGAGKTAVSARLALASCGRTSPAADPAQPPIGSGSISAAVFCRAGKETVPELIQQLSRQLAESVDGFAGALQASLPQGINIFGPVTVSTGDVGAGATVAGVNITLPSDDELVFSRFVARPLRQLRESGAAQPVVLLVDAIDEAGTVSRNTFSRMLARLDGVHLIATSRPDKLVLYDFRKARRALDLVADAPPGDHDVRDYVRMRLRGRAPYDAVAVLADRIAAEAAGNFLYAFFVTRPLAQSGSLANLDGNLARVLSLPADGLPGVYGDFLDRQIGGDETRWADELRPVLGPLCAARGDGFTTEQLRQIAGRLTGRTFSLDKARDVTGGAAQFLTGPKPDGPFRVYHESFARFLTDSEQNPYWPVDLPGTSAAIVDALTGALPEDPLGGRDWTAAPAYVRRHLAVHADAAGPAVLLALVRDLDFLAVAAPVSVGPLLSPSDPQLGGIARIYRRAGPLLSPDPQVAPANAAYLREAACALTGSAKRFVGATSSPTVP